MPRFLQWKGSTNMGRNVYTPDNKNELITKEMLHGIYGCPECDIICKNCTMINWDTVNFDQHTVHCMYWKQRILWNCFCGHFQLRGGKQS